MKRDRGDSDEDDKNESLLEACRSGDYAGVCSALNAGADVDTAACLSVACAGEDIFIVYELLRRGADCQVTDDAGFTALHHAASMCNVEVVCLLLKHGALVDQMAMNRVTPLLECASNEHAFMDYNAAYETMKALLEAGANVQCDDALLKWTALHLACMNLNVKCIGLLLQYGALPNVADKNGVTPMMLACENRLEGQNMIPVLVSAGANPYEGVASAFNAGGIMITALLPFISTRYIIDIYTVSRSSPDPIGALRAVKRGMPLDWGEVDFSNNLVNSDPRALIADANFWAMLRVTDWYTYDIDFLQNVNKRAYYYASCEMATLRCASTGDTLLHVAARRNDPDSVHMLMRRGINPLLFNSSRKLAVDVTTDATTCCMLREYAKWKPTRVCTEWYGPFFRMRAVAFLLVALRWRNECIRRIPRDIVMFILEHVSKLEHV